ncbi:type IV secretory system conjugative DNA transfer family protein [Hasllibacter sp. MH4015]|uniref:type IV secretory system conjugative DNA transfer family protein n=1 Tax=Hasllibacter sp. MH4015 TaxID=2854029 RepID=UPI001CD6A8DD|nr:type IV secretory system conjugative DNA transfer family protein [Hasllibacter sp. MH4015]
MRHVPIFIGAMALATGLTGLGVGDAMAQSFYTDGSDYARRYQQQLLAQLAMMRVGMIILATGFGFGLGWFLSPYAAQFRATIAILAGIAAVIIAGTNHGWLGWSTAFVMAVVGFVWGLGFWAGQTIRAMAEVPETFGSSRWATAAHLIANKLFNTGGILLGLAHDGEKLSRIFYQGDRHILTVAPTRAWKGISHIVPNLLTYLGSVLVIDPKGENALITAKARQDMGQTVHLIDPWNIAAHQLEMTPARFNPIDWIQLTDPDATENAMLLADALVEHNSKTDTFWLEEAKALLQGLILLVAFDETYNGKRNLGTVRDLLLLDGDQLEELFRYMANSPHHLVRSTGSRCLQKEPKLMANVMASAQAETHMLDSDRIRESLSASDFDFADLKKKAVSIYMILPADRLQAFNKLLRLQVQQAITVNARNIEDKPAKPVLFILDEMPALGRLAMVEQAYGLMAGFGIQLWGITQDLCQLRRVYGEDYESFIANSGAVAYFGSPDKTSTEYFSAACGTTTVWNFSSAVSNAFNTNAGSSGSSSGKSMTYSDNRAASQRNLAYPDELRRLPLDRQLLLIENMDPIMAKKIRWFEDEELSAKGVNTHDS